MQLRRDFEISCKNKVLIVEDVITTGESSLEVARIIEEENARVVGFSCIVLRGEVTYKLSPIFYLQKLILPVYAPSDCPMCKNNIPIQIPGTKQLTTS
ncbi:MAG: phosphoribosyltransferase family protein [Planctomycetota bacterium]